MVLSREPVAGLGLPKIFSRAERNPRRFCFPKQTYRHIYKTALNLPTLARNVLSLDGSRTRNGHIARHPRGGQPIRIHQDSPSPTPDISADHRKRQNSSITLQDLPDTDINRKTRGQGGGKRARNAQSARNLDVAAITSQQAEIQNTQRRQIIRPQQQNAYLRPRSA